jgi:hypothetical protein
MSRHVSCASCHIDVRFDRLAWDLGIPNGETDASRAEDNRERRARVALRPGVVRDSWNRNAPPTASPLAELLALASPANAIAFMASRKERGSAVSIDNRRGRHRQSRGNRQWQRSTNRASPALPPLREFEIPYSAALRDIRARPLIGNTTRCLPLRRASEDSHFHQSRAAESAAAPPSRQPGNFDWIVSPLAAAQFWTFNVRITIADQLASFSTAPSPSSRPLLKPILQLNEREPQLAIEPRCCGWFAPTFWDNATKSKQRRPHRLEPDRAGPRHRRGILPFLERPSANQTFLADRS